MSPVSPTEEEIGAASSENGSSSPRWNFRYGQVESSQVAAQPQDEGGFAPGFLSFDLLLTLHASRLCFVGLPFTAEARIENIETKHKGLRFRNTRAGDHYGRHK
jgi:hypothetical protein